MEEKLTNRALKRIERSKLNTTIGLVTSILMGVFSFVERTIFNQYFIVDYLGLYSFNYNIIYTLAYIELGLNTSICFALYKPLEYDNREQIIAIMQFYRKAYLAVGTFIIVGGLCLLPFIKYLVQTSVPIHNVQIYFVIFLVANASSYIVTYKNVLFTANQEDYKLTLVGNISWCILYVLEIIVSVTTQNFLYYSIALFIGYCIKNFSMRIMANRAFPFLKTKKKIKMDKDIMNHVKRNTKGMIFNRLGQVMVSATDSILISALVGTAVLGKYSNYQILYSGLLTLSLLVPRSITASLGNAGVTETKRTMVKSFYSLDLGSYFVYGFLTVMLICVANPIISTFFGSDRILPLSTILLYFASFYLESQRELLLSYKASLGLYWDDRWRPIAEGAINLVASLILGWFFGLNGIIIGTLISQIFINFVIEPLIVFHKGFNHSAFWYYVSAVLRFILIAISTVLSFLLLRKCNIAAVITGTLTIGSLSLSMGGLIQIVLNFIICFAVTVFIFFIAFHRSENAKVIIKTLKIAFLSKSEKRKLMKELEQEEKKKDKKNKKNKDTHNKIN